MPKISKYLERIGCSHCAWLRGASSDRPSASQLQLVLKEMGPWRGKQAAEAADYGSQGLEGC